MSATIYLNLRFHDSPGLLDRARFNMAFGELFTFT